MSISGISKMNMDPDMYAQMYAQKNGISTDDAKTQLEAQHGTPQKPQDSQNSCFEGLKFGGSQDEMKPSSLDDPEFAVDSNFSIQDIFKDFMNIFNGNNESENNDSNSISNDSKVSESSNSQKPDQGTNPDDYASQYASDNGLSVDDAKSELKNMYGDPEEKNIFLNA